ncbi:MAG: ComF family protein [Rickettsiales bacterium]|jgi:ComF family protein|nr:ComF family protein [Rickettsiales bacterium]
MRNFIRKIVDFVFPPTCPLCGGMLSGADGACPECFAKLELISEPKCAYCGSPFEFMPDGGARLVCIRCLKSKPKFDRCVSAAKYNEASRRIILPFKHGDRTNLSKFIAGVMAASGAELLASADAIIPVPIHRLRMMKRKYNQAAEIARRLGSITGKPVMYDALARTKRTPSQGRMSAIDRKRNVRGAFAIVNPDALKGMKILLVDDVLTSGATANECAKTLKGAGAKKVFVLTFARA